MKGYLTLQEASGRYGIAPSSLRQAARLGSLRAKKVGEDPRSTYYVTAEEVERYLEDRPPWIKKREAAKKPQP